MIHKKICALVFCIVISSSNSYSAHINVIEECLQEAALIYIAGIATFFALQQGYTSLKKDDTKTTLEHYEKLVRACQKNNHFTPECTQAQEIIKQMQTLIHAYEQKK